MIQGKKIELINMDCLEALKNIPTNSVDSIVTDPPYELGFMGKGWDKTGIANDTGMWAECLRVLKPGGHLLSFGGTRTYHRMACAIEDAGFEVRDMIEWVYSTGFPKSLNIGKAVDKLQGNERKVVGEKPTLHHGTKDNVQKYGFATEGNIELTKGTSEWEGWGTALKPAHEPICMARKPLSEKTVAENVLKYGTGGINIDESRVYTEYYLRGNDLSDIISICQLNHLKLSANNAELKKFQEDTTSVIKNLFSVAENVDMPILEKILGKVQEDIIKKDTQCSEEMLMESINTNLNTFTSGKNIMEKSQQDLKYITSMVLKMITDWKIYNVSAYQLTEVLLTKAKNEVNTREKLGRFPANLLHDNSEEVRGCFPNESERFFKSIIYQAKASKSERNKGCEGLEENKTLYNQTGLKNNGDGTERPIGGMKNNHPTVKPIALMEYLIKMVTKPGGTIVDPFMGSGTTGVAAKKLKMGFIGVEKDKEHFKICQARINYNDAQQELF